MLIGPFMSNGTKYSTLICYWRKWSPLLLTMFQIHLQLQPEVHPKWNLPSHEKSENSVSFKQDSRMSHPSKIPLTIAPGPHCLKKNKNKTRIIYLFFWPPPLHHYNQGLFTWREEDPGTRKILEGGITLRWVYMQKFRPVSCPSREG